MAERTDYYAVLGVARDADLSAIKVAYRRLANAHHPDRNQDDRDATPRFQVLVEAYSVLGHPSRRAEYDAGRPVEAVQVERGAPWAELFGRILDPFIGVADRVARRGRDTRYQLALSFSQAAMGCVRTLSLPHPVSCSACGGRGFDLLNLPSFCERCSSVGSLEHRPSLGRERVPCPDCEGRGYRVEDPCEPCSGSGETMERREFQIEVPARARHAQRLRVRAAGAAGTHGGPAGDCIVELSVEEDGRFRVEEDDLWVRQAVSPSRAAAGGWLEVPTLTGVTRIRVPQGSQQGAVLRMEGHGLTRAGGGRGDQFVTLVMESSS